MHTKALGTELFGMQSYDGDLCQQLCAPGGVKGQTWPRAEASSSGSPQGCDQLQTVLFD